MFNVQCFFYAYFKITISRINHFKTITPVVVFTGCAWWQMFFDRRRWSSMFLYSGGQMSDSFANIGRIYITQTCKLIYDIGHQGHRGMALQGKIIFHFERGEHYFNIYFNVYYFNMYTLLSFLKRTYVSRNALNLNFSKLQYEDFTSCIFTFISLYPHC